MEWPNKMAIFVLLLLLMLTIGAIIKDAYKIFIRPRLDKLRLKRRLKRAVTEAEEIISGKKSAPASTEFAAQDDGGMIIRSYKNDILIREEAFTPWEWSQEKKVLNEIIRKKFRK